MFARATGERLKIWLSYRLIAMRVFFNLVTPFSAGEHPFLIYALSREGIQGGKATAIVIVRLITGLSMVAGHLLAVGQDAGWAGRCGDPRIDHRRCGLRHGAQHGRPRLGLDDLRGVHVRERADSYEEAVIQIAHPRGYPGYLEWYEGNPNVPESAKETMRAGYKRWNQKLVLFWGMLSAAPHPAVFIIAALANRIDLIFWILCVPFSFYMILMIVFQRLSLKAQLQEVCKTRSQEIADQLGPG